MKTLFLNHEGFVWNYDFSIRKKENYVLKHENFVRKHKNDVWNLENFLRKHKNHENYTGNMKNMNAWKQCETINYISSRLTKLSSLI